MKLTGENRSAQIKKTVPVPLCPPQIPHGLTRGRTRASMVGAFIITLIIVIYPTTVVIVLRSLSITRSLNITPF
jgi:hypothetical protein